MKELEEQAIEVARVVAADTYPGPDRIALAMERFAAWRRDTGTLSRESVPYRNRLRLVLAPAIAGTLAVAVLVGIRFFVRPHDARPAHAVSNAADAPPVLNTLVLAEKVAARQPCHQTFVIEIGQPDSGRPVRHRLEIWSDAAGHRFAAELRNARGEIETAVWRPADSQPYRLHPVKDPAASFLEVASSATLRQMERKIVAWLGNLELRPVSLAENFAEFAGGDVRVRMVNEGTTMTLSASRVQNEVTSDVVLEVDRSTSRARSLTMRLSQNGRVAEMRIIAEKTEILSARELQPIVFEAKIPRPATISNTLIAEPHTEPITAIDLPDQEVGVHAALHRLGACIIDPIEVERDGATIRVRGLVETDERRTQILQSLENFSAVQVTIETVAQAATRQALPSVSPAPVTIRLEAGPPRIEARWNPDAVTRVSNQAVSLSATALQHGWAIHRLRSAFSATVPPRILEIIADHLDSLRRTLAAERAILQPVLPAPSDSHDASLSPFQAAQSVDDLIRSLFSSGRAQAGSLDADLQRLSNLLSNDFSEREP
jgi:hypothetical protein